MLAVRVIPCLDIKDGSVVKGVKFEGLKIVGDPLELAQKYNDENADELIFLDITATNEARETKIDLAVSLARRLFIPFTIGGGISNLEQIHELVSKGADKISLNSAAVKNPELISQGAECFGSQCIVVAIDVKKVSEGKWNVFVNAGKKDTGKDAVEWAMEAERRGAGEILLTGMDTDGCRQGFDIEITRAISERISIPVIASGGGGELSHFSDVVHQGKADAVLAAGIFHSGEYSINQVKAHMRENSISVRL